MYYLAKFEPTLANCLCYWANFHCSKWASIEQNVLPSGHSVRKLKCCVRMLRSLEGNVNDRRLWKTLERKNSESKHSGKVTQNRRRKRLIRRI